MKRRLPKLWQHTAVTLTVVTVAVLLSASAVFAADSKPYFRTSHGGVFAGGAYSNGACSTTGDQYQSPYNPTGSDDAFKGAILAFGTVSGANGSNRLGAQSGLDAFALGNIEGKASNQYGFFSGLVGQGNPQGTNSLSFSNYRSELPSGDFWGGNLEGNSTRFTHCIPDYYTTKIDSATKPVLDGTANPADISAQDLGNAQKEILFVNGDAYISGNIRYNYSPKTIQNIPHFALVVKGDIYISDQVNQLDGWYIAQPDSSGNGGTIWTCHKDETAQPDDQWMRDKCDDRTLTVNGAFSAKQVNLGRISGDISGGPAEQFVYTPEMLLGGPFFDETGNSSSTSGNIQSLINLPPIF